MKLQLTSIFIFIGFIASAQFSKLPYTLDANYFYGSIIEHNDEISHLITGHPTGYIFSYNKKTYGFKKWQARYNYPDYGISYIKQNLKNKYLGKNQGLYSHINFYFFKRYLMLRLGQGIAYASSPYDKHENYRNNAYGTRFLSSTYFMLQFKKEHLFKGLGVNAGLSLIHYSNANVKAPNASTNTLAINFGLNYLMRYKHNPVYRSLINDVFEKQRIKFNFAFRSGINESDVVGAGQYPFYVVTAYADKRLNHKSALQIGADMFWSLFLKEHIKFVSMAYPTYNVNADTDYKRVGAFIGHELFVSKFSFLTQVGYYLYYPYDFEGRLYNRLGFKYYFNKTIYSALTLKAHVGKAEAVEFGIGIRI